jgi:hypothetical protein
LPAHGTRKAAEARVQTPFSADQFFNVFAQYNEAVWPSQVILMALALLIVGVAVFAPRYSGVAIGILAALWAWTAIAYHSLFFARINPIANVFAALFLFEAAAIAWHGLRTRRLELKAGLPVALRTGGWTLIAYALVVYPALAMTFGQRYPAMPTFGLPCPTTIFTLGILLWCRRPVPWLVLIVPAVWAAIATSAAVTFSVFEDYALPLAAALLIIARLRTTTTKTARVA